MLSLFVSFYLRVVSTEQNTTVTWDTADGATAGSKVMADGEVVELYNNLASQPMRVVTDKPCVVMQYNPGLCLLSFYYILLLLYIFGFYKPCAIVTGHATN